MLTFSRTRLLHGTSLRTVRKGVESTLASPAELMYGSGPSSGRLTDSFVYIAILLASLTRFREYAGTIY